MIRRACLEDLEILKAWDRHISEESLKKSIENGFVYLVEADGTFTGWLRYNLFWDSIPFLNMLFVLEEYRGQGFGKALMTQWEQETRDQGFRDVMTSTSACEDAQCFYRKLGYETVGGFFPPQESYELILTKHFI